MASLRIVCVPTSEVRGGRCALIDGAPETQRLLAPALRGRPARGVPATCRSGEQLTVGRFL
jgi:hypothetical protein